MFMENQSKQLPYLDKFIVLFNMPLENQILKK